MNSAAPQATVKDYLWCLFLALPWIGVQSLWASEFGTVDGTLKELGLSASMAKLTWVWGPITGFFTAPIIGAFSDNSTSKYGRRRPFMIAGLISFILSSLLFGFSGSMGSSGVYAAYIGFIMMDITINIMQTPIRAYTSDMVPAHMQNTVQLMAVACQGTGGIIGSQVMANFYDGKAHTLPVVIFTVVGLNILFTGLVCAFGKEEIHHGNGEKISISAPFVQIFKNLVNLDFKLIIIFACEFFSWASLFTFWPHANDWVTTDLYGGDVTAPEGSAAAIAAKDGAQAANQAGTWQNLIQIILGVTIGYLMLKGILKSVRFVWALGLAVGAVSLILTNVITDRGYGPTLIILMGVMMSAINAFPFAIVGTYNRDEGGLDTGVQFGMMNMFICLAQFIMQFVVAGITSFKTCLLISGILGLCAALCACFVKEYAPETATERVEKKV
ncbi:hypothetical protein HDV03_001000 [Kappamyces sp. JEL0829]|nr:hypothetical protein HDV03_001000 [Kappamyces sp. JEL0829]